MRERYPRDTHDSLLFRIITRTIARTHEHDKLLFTFYDSFGGSLYERVQKSYDY